jgi:hypothetical protein
MPIGPNDKILDYVTILQSTTKSDVKNDFDVTNTNTGVLIPTSDGSLYGWFDENFTFDATPNDEEIIKPVNQDDSTMPLRRLVLLTPLRITDSANKGWTLTNSGGFNLSNGFYKINDEKINAYADERTLTVGDDVNKNFKYTTITDALANKPADANYNRQFVVYRSAGYLEEDIETTGSGTILDLKRSAVHGEMRLSWDSIVYTSKLLYNSPYSNKYLALLKDCGTIYNAYVYTIQAKADISNQAFAAQGGTLMVDNKYCSVTKGAIFGAKGYHDGTVTFYSHLAKFKGSEPDGTLTAAFQGKTCGFINIAKDFTSTGAEPYLAYTISASSGEDSEINLFINRSESGINVAKVGTGMVNIIGNNLRGKISVDGSYSPVCNYIANYHKGSIESVNDGLVYGHVVYGNVDIDPKYHFIGIIGTGLYGSSVHSNQYWHVKRADLYASYFYLEGAYNDGATTKFMLKTGGHGMFYIEAQAYARDTQVNIQNQNSNHVSNLYIDSLDNGVDLPVFATDGVLYTGSPSDKRLKTNIQKYKHSISDKFSKLEFKKFKWKNNKTDDWGLIAQDVEKIFDDVVIEPKNKKSFKTINTKKLLLYTMKTVVELIDRIEKIEKKISKDINSRRRMK